MSAVAILSAITGKGGEAKASATTKKKKQKAAAAAADPSRRRSRSRARSPAQKPPAAKKSTPKKSNPMKPNPKKSASSPNRLSRHRATPLAFEPSMKGDRAILRDSGALLNSLAGYQVGGKGRDVFYVDTFAPSSAVRSFPRARPRDLKTDPAYTKNDWVKANFRGEGDWYPGRVTKVWPIGTYNVAYDDGDKESHVPEEWVRLQKKGL